ncbi:kinase modulator [Lithospermum erythrorhizon]|uniref:Kinase modulator n=1 Tax=Lithospermum erythrorhizon TaxID=34254 RepID=A0AAV3QHG9_LITER
MAISFLKNRVISELCLGKPVINSTVTSRTSIKEVLTLLKGSGYSISHVSVWSCVACDDDHHDFPHSCVAKISMADVICYLCKKENLSNPLEALEAPVSTLLPQVNGIVSHLEPNSSLLEAIDCILEGSQNLVIPIREHPISKSMREFLEKDSPPGALPLYDSKEYCWLTQEDIARFLLNSIGVFSPLPTFTIESLNIIDREVMSIHYDDPVSLALNSISCSITEQTCVAVVDDDKRLIGEISPYTLASCDETVAAAMMTLSAGDLMAYIDCGGPPDGLVQLVKTRLEEKGLDEMLKVVNELSSSHASSSLSSFSSSSCSSDDESGSSSSRNSYSFNRSSSTRRSEAIMCFRWSSLVAVMVQALAHRVSYIWVVKDDQTLVGIVTFQEIFKVFRSLAGGRHKQEMENPFKQ